MKCPICGSELRKTCPKCQYDTRIDYIAFRTLGDITASDSTKFFQQLKKANEILASETAKSEETKRIEARKAEINSETHKESVAKAHAYLDAARESRSSTELSITSSVQATPTSKKVKKEDGNPIEPPKPSKVETPPVQATRTSDKDKLEDINPTEAKKASKASSSQKKPAPSTKPKEKARTSSKRRRRRRSSHPFLLLILGVFLGILAYKIFISKVPPEISTSQDTPATQSSAQSNPLENDNTSAEQYRFAVQELFENFINDIKINNEHYTNISTEVFCTYAEEQGLNVFKNQTEGNPGTATLKSTHNATARMQFANPQTADEKSRLMLWAYTPPTYEEGEAEDCDILDVITPIFPSPLHMSLGMSYTDCLEKMGLPADYSNWILQSTSDTPSYIWPDNEGINWYVSYVEDQDNTTLRFTKIIDDIGTSSSIELQFTKLSDNTNVLTEVILFY